MDEGIIVLLVIVVLIYIAINAYCAYLMKNATVMKGYGDDMHIWAICFWLGIFGYLYALCLPDKVQQAQNQQIIELLKKGE